MHEVFAVTVAKKLAILPAISLMGILLVSIVLMRDILAVYRSADYANENSLPSVLTLRKLEASFIGVRLNVWQHVATDDAAGMAAAEKQMQGRRESVELAFARI